jgi:NAD(P)-dependent dehydrogenase (short-subunit alcohol dehydrogenase family)
MINADAVFGDPSRPRAYGRRWAPRARSRAAWRRASCTGVLPQRNLLKALILPEHVGNAVVFLASNQTPTTGATIPVYGGVLEAFPR